MLFKTMGPIQTSLATPLSQDFFSIKFTILQSKNLQLGPKSKVIELVLCIKNTHLYHIKVASNTLDGFTIDKSPNTQLRILVESDKNYALNKGARIGPYRCFIQEITFRNIFKKVAKPPTSNVLIPANSYTSLEIP